MDTFCYFREHKRRSLSSRSMRGSLMNSFRLFPNKPQQLKSFIILLMFFSFRPHIWFLEKGHVLLCSKSATFSPFNRTKLVRPINLSPKLYDKIVLRTLLNIPSLEIVAVKRILFMVSVYVTYTRQRIQWLMVFWQ